MTGSTTISLDLSSGKVEEYQVNYPNVYVKGLLFGTMMLELGDTAEMKCPDLDLMCDMEFTTKGYFSGQYNGIKGRVKRISSGEILYTLSGKWTETIFIQDSTVRGAKQEIFFDVDTVKIMPKQVLPESEQEEYESRRLWTKLTSALLKRDTDLATDEKTKVEDHQRQLRQQREQSGAEYKTRFFKCENDVWYINQREELQKISDPSAAKQRLKQIIFNKQ